MTDEVAYNPFSMQPQDDGTGILSGAFAGWGQPATLQDMQMRGIQSQMDTDATTRAMNERMGQPLTGFSKGVQNFGTIAQGLAGLGSVWMGLKNLKLQKQAFEFNKGVTNTNLNNSILDYNRRLGDTLANRALNNNQGQGWISSQLSKYSAKRS